MTTNAVPTLWFLNGPLFLLYLIAALIVYVLCVINDKVSISPRRQKPLSPAVIAGLAMISNILGIVTLVAVAAAMSNATRLGMLLLPLVILGFRYYKVIRRTPHKWRAPAAGLGGSVAGLAIGAWLFMRNEAAPEPVGHAVLPGDVHTLRLSEVMNSQAWTVSLQLVLFYLISLSIFFVLQALLRRSAPRLMAGPEQERRKRAALTVFIAFALNFLGVLALVWLADASDMQIRLAMVGLPLLLILETYVNLLRKEPHNRPAHWTGLIGSCSGMVLAAVLLLRGAPLH